ncbi:hypothetical protein Xsto_03481 [Xenorhabdus stockiae]|uniref:Uncharacterized protein n=1 Tax=Xenorhabdus stockiae TaxID=351614 RepID=A0A2D0KKI6_9GAMM|nr:hypothetical protein Xekk_01584 [Xenorhabdus sp. KK7.4]PHM63951.1 hypothetical protein Xsto_03481 [Xenorhabdus stockiae]
MEVIYDLYIFYIGYILGIPSAMAGISCIFSAIKTKNKGNKKAFAIFAILFLYPPIVCVYEVF